MRKANYLPFILGAVGMLVIILDSKTAVAGVRAGLELCLQTLIPSLFPFFVLSALVTGSLTGISITPMRWLCRICRMPLGSESLLIVGILGGYPVGAGNIAAMYHNGNLSLKDAQRLAVFCNNAGPSFLFGILGAIFPHMGWVWALWCIQITASILTGMCLSGGTTCEIVRSNSKSVSIPDAVSRAVRSMALVCGWIILFRLILTFLNRWFLWLLTDAVRVLMTGILELSNGCLDLSDVTHVEYRFVLAGIMLSLGGISVWMQTQAVFPAMSLPYYIKGRILHTAFCLILSLPVILFSEETQRINSLLLVFVSLSVILPTLMLRKQKKAVAFC